MAHSTTALATKHPNYASKDAMIRSIRQHIHPNCPQAVEILLRIAHSDLNLWTSDKSTVTPTTFGL